MDKPLIDAKVAVEAKYDDLRAEIDDINAKIQVLASERDELTNQANALGKSIAAFVDLQLCEKHHEEIVGRRTVEQVEMLTTVKEIELPTTE